MPATVRKRCPALLLGSLLAMPGCGSDTPTGAATILVDDTQLQDKGRLLSWSIRLRLRR